MAPPLRFAPHYFAFASLMLLAALLFTDVVRPAHAADADGVSAADRPVSFRRDIAPVLVKRCLGCHSSAKAKGKYRLDTFDRLMKPGSSDASPVEAGKPGRSELLRLIESKDDDERMPKKGDRLTDAQIGEIRRWIEQGAKFDGPSSTDALESFSPAEIYAAPPEVYSRPVPVAALAFSPDGAELLAGGYHEVTVWGSSSGKLLRRIKDLPQQTQALAFSPDGALLAFAGGTPGTVGEVRLIAPFSGQPVKILDRLGDMVLAVCFSPDGSRVAAGGVDNAIRVYDVKSGKRLLLIEQHADWVTGLAFSPNGKHIASASRDKSCRIFDAKTGEMTEAYLDHDEAVLSIAWSDDNQTLFSADKARKIHVWSAKDGKKTAEFDSHGGEVFRLVSAPGTIFAACSDGTVRAYSQATHENVHVFSPLGDWAYAIAVDPKHERIAAGSYGGKVQVWKINDGEKTTSFVAAPGLTEASAGK